jgi:hypothetical protein
LSSKPWIWNWIRIRNEKKCWIWIRIKSVQIHNPPKFLYKNKKVLTQQRNDTENKDDNEIFAADEYDGGRRRRLAIASLPGSGTRAPEMVLIAEVDATSAVEAEVRVLALVRVDTLGGAKATLALRTAVENNK